MLLDERFQSFVKNIFKVVKPFYIRMFYGTDTLYAHIRIIAYCVFPPLSARYSQYNGNLG